MKMQEKSINHFISCREVWPEGIVVVNKVGLAKIIKERQISLFPEKFEMVEFFVNN